MVAGCLEDVCRYHCTDNQRKKWQKNWEKVPGRHVALFTAYTKSFQDGQLSVQS